ncbi:RecBCD enzyme subunit RecB [Betaproteobacteria bacterium]|nr:RecBCD enzyme subunit RecB [Betaproteobacteria bacterium]GHU31038.1 RecBCD enzyme subunit RecB [Betaproteobacteria bacterium]
MNNPPETLQPLTFPLYGSRLIEASAGTGKTYTIAALYLRLILGHGGDNAFSKPLLPTQILVTTFTNAAASELRERIRTRLVEAAAVLRGEEEGDDLLQELCGSIPAEERQNKAKQLELAAEWMDEAVISTIHGWCQRMLSEHAFDSRSLFNLTLQTDHSELLAEVTRDYWRVQCYPLQGEALEWVIKNWQTPDELCKELKDLLKEDVTSSKPSLKTLLDATLQQRAQELAALKAPWSAWVEELQALFDAAQKEGKLSASTWSVKSYNARLDRLREWLGEASGDLSFSGDFFKRLTRTGIEGVCKKGFTLTLSDSVRQALQDMETLEQRLQALPDPSEAALRHAVAWVRERFTGEKVKRAEIGFDDMLTRLDDALQGEDGERLAEVIRRQFPVAMIDEFQDTDPLQYRIFDRIYKVAAKPLKSPLPPVGEGQGRGGAAVRHEITLAHPEPSSSPTRGEGSGLFIIGDPKQAIYSFRGADIHTYLQARRATEGRHYSLATNFRSSKDMVAAVNRVFRQAEERGDKGAFGFGDDLPFDDAEAKGRDEVWKVEGQTQSALTVWYLRSEMGKPLGKPFAKGAYVDAMAVYAAEEIARLLKLGRQNRAGFSKNGQLTALRPNDIAVLVRDGNEAKAIRRQLSLRRIQSVYLSDKDSVFDSQEARDLRLWLCAAAAPENDRALRAALASRTLNLDLAELEALTHDEQLWEARVQQFCKYQKCWQKQGVLPMLRHLLHDFKLPARLKQRDEGERALTNLLHLSELLQQAAAELDGEQALIRYLDEHLTGNPPGEEQILRLESDEKLVRVVTIHKSKGLEYPLVFLPFICTFKPLKGDKPFVVHDKDQRQVVFNADDETLKRADAERLGEDLRLLYVALTRARHACWLGTADLIHDRKYGMEYSAPGYLLDARNTPLTEALNALQDGRRIKVLEVVKPEPGTPLTHYESADIESTATNFKTPRHRATAENWWIASYSALRAESKGGTSIAPSDDAPRHDDAAPESLSMQNASDDDTTPSPVTRPLSPDDMHRFPRGSNPGTFLHGLLELAAAEGFADTETLRGQIASRCQRRGWKGWIKHLTNWLLALLQQPLPLGEGRTVRLADLKCPQSEMEFWFETHHLDASKLDSLVQQFECPGQPRPARGAGDILNGMFKGFIDLAFEYDGRYYVADYKSNWLGADDAAYTQDALREAMLEHRYDLQYTLYLLALHRQLTLRLPDYDYDRHMGGALYLFLRAPANGVYLARPPRELIERLDALFKGEHEECTA